jgi:hypothetical protein
MRAPDGKQMQMQALMDNPQRPLEFSKPVGEEGNGASAQWGAGTCVAFEEAAGGPHAREQDVALLLSHSLPSGQQIQEGRLACMPSQPVREMPQMCPGMPAVCIGRSHATPATNHTAAHLP